MAAAAKKRSTARSLRSGMQQSLNACSCPVMQCHNVCCVTIFSFCLKFAVICVSCRKFSYYFDPVILSICWWSVWFIFIECGGHWCVVLRCAWSSSLPVRLIAGRLLVMDYFIKQRSLNISSTPAALFLSLRDRPKPDLLCNTTRCQ